MIKIIDIHAHLNWEYPAGQWREVLSRAGERGISTIVIGADVETSRRAVEMCAEESTLLGATVGIHPDDMGQISNWPEIESLAKNERVVAIGECGLDYYRMMNDELGIINEKKKQTELFLKHVKLAQEVGKPLVIHCRASKGTQDAYADLYDLLIQNLKFNIPNSDPRVGVMHFFSGNLDSAKKFVELGFSLSFAGPITFARDYDEVIKWVPEDRIMAETDSPFAAPVPYRGKRNEPAYVEEVIKKMAELRGVGVAQMAQTTTQNAVKLFNLKI